MNLPYYPTRRRKSGFTLLELALVLVILGLLVGGILFGRDLIRLGELHRQVSQLREYELAFNTFKVKYGCLPGDCAQAQSLLGDADSSGNAILNGNGDGLIDTASRITFNDNESDTWSGGEIVGVFQELGAAGFINFMPSDPDAPAIGVGLPPLTLNPRATFFIGANYNFETKAYGVDSADEYLTEYKRGNNALWMVACNVTSDIIGYWNDGCGIFSAFDLLYIDAKLDDGKALSGNFLGFGGDNFPGPANLQCLINYEYNFFNVTNECQAVYVIN